MKKTFIVLFLIASYFLSFSQDVIIKKNGEEVNCKIINEDSVNIYLTITRNDKVLSSFISKEQVQKIIYEKDLIQNNSSDSIVIVGKGYRSEYYHKGNYLDEYGLAEILKTNRRAYNKFQTSKVTRIFGYGFAYAGGFMIGWPIGTALGGGDPEWALLGIGAGFVVIALSFELGADAQVRKAAKIYNKGLLKSTSVKKEIRIGFTPDGVMLCLKF